MHVKRKIKLKKKTANPHPDPLQYPTGSGRGRSKCYPSKKAKFRLRFGKLKDVFFRVAFLFAMRSTNSTVWEEYENSLILVTPAVYPHLDDFTGKLNFRYQSRSTQLRILKPSLEHSRGSSEFPNKNLRQIRQGVSEL